MANNLKIVISGADLNRLLKGDSITYPISSVPGCDALELQLGASELDHLEEFGRIAEARPGLVRAARSALEGTTEGRRPAGGSVP